MIVDDFSGVKWNMCLAVPGKVVKLEDHKALIDFGGAKRRVNVSMLEDVAIGEYVIVHVGYAIQKLSEKEARESIELWEEILGEEGH